MGRTRSVHRIASANREGIGEPLLARLAVEQSQRGRGLGWFLMSDALIRSSAASEIIAARAVVVHALDSDAASFT
jgi:predicted GNAT family N-acyltransferase